MQGQSNFIATSNAAPAGAPFPAGTAENGTSIDPVSGKVVLGQNPGEAGDPGAVINNREIPILNGAEFTLGQIGLNAAWLVVNTVFQVVAIGSDVNNSNNARFVADGVQRVCQVVAANYISLLCGTGVIKLDTPLPAVSGNAQVVLRNNAGGADDSQLQTITGVSGNFTTADGKTVTVTQGIITAIV